MALEDDVLHRFQLGMKHGYRRLEWHEHERCLVARNNVEQASIDRYEPSGQTGHRTRLGLIITCSSGRGSCQLLLQRESNLSQVVRRGDIMRLLRVREGLQQVIEELS